VEAGRRTGGGASAWTHVLVLEEAQHLQLPEHPLTRNQVLEDIGHLLEGHLLTVPRVRHRPGGEDRGQRTEVRGQRIEDRG